MVALVVVVVVVVVVALVVVVVVGFAVVAAALKWARRAASWAGKRKRRCPGKATCLPGEGNAR